MEPLVDGMAIATADVVANVEVRSKSVGPGGCAVEFSTNGARIGFVAAPLIYSPWTVLTASAGRNRFVIGESVKCNTGVLSQVRYWRDGPAGRNGRAARP